MTFAHGQRQGQPADLQHGIHDICLLSPPPSCSAGILRSTAAAATTATVEAEAEAAEGGRGLVGGVSVGGSGGLAAWDASGRQFGVVWRRKCRHRDPTVWRRTDRRPRSLAGLSPPGWEPSFAMHSFAGTRRAGFHSCSGCLHVLRIADVALVRMLAFRGRHNKKRSPAEKASNHRKRHVA